MSGFSISAAAAVVSPHLIDIQRVAPEGTDSFSSRLAAVQKELFLPEKLDPTKDFHRFSTPDSSIVLLSPKKPMSEHEMHQYQAACVKLGNELDRASRSVVLVPLMAVINYGGKNYIACETNPDAVPANTVQSSYFQSKTDEAAHFLMGKGIKVTDATLLAKQEAITRETNKHRDLGTMLFVAPGALPRS